MYQFLNCFPLGSASKIIHRIKLLKRRTHPKNTTKSSTLDLKVSKENAFNDKQSDDLIDVYGCKEVKLVSYSNVNISVGQEAVLCNENDNLVEIRKSLSRMNSTCLEKIVEEGQKTIEVLDEEKCMKREDIDKETVPDQILHKLHVNSFTYEPMNTSLSNQSCTLAKHADRNLETVADQTDCFLNEIAKNAISKTMHSDSSLIVHNGSTNKLSKNLINIPSDNIDEINTLTDVKTNFSANDQSIPNDLSTTNDQQNQHTADSVPFDDTKCKTNKKFIQETDLHTNAILNGVETWIELNKNSNCALGINLIDRIINDRKLFIIHEIVKNGIAETDHRLKVGDIILQVNEIPLKDMSSEDAVGHLNCTSGSVRLLIYRELICVNDQSSSQSDKSKNVKVNYPTQSTMQENGRDENVEQKVINGQLYEIIKVQLQKKINKGLGICIVNDDRSPGPYISEILPNSAAHLEGRLKKGDHIINVNGDDVSNYPINTILTMLKCLQGSITLKVARLMPGQVIVDEFTLSLSQPVEIKQMNFKVLVLNSKQKNMVNLKRKLMNDRVKDLVVHAPKDTDSINNFLLLNETINDEELNSNSEINSTSNKNWVKIDKMKGITNQILNEQLAINKFPNVDQLLNENRIIEIDGRHFNDINIENLFEKLERSSSIQMIVSY